MSPAKPTATPSKGLILVVDDQAIIREPIAQCLTSAGYTVELAGSAREALDSAEAHSPDLILLDVHMPGVDGLACLATLRSRPRTASTPVIFLTNETNHTTVLQASKLGVKEYVLKSAFRVANLLARIDRLLAA